MASDIATGLLPLLGAALGTISTLAVQRASTRASRMQYALELHTARRAEIRSAVIAYLEQAQRLQGELDARERGEEPAGLKQLIEKLWLAEKQVEIIASDRLGDLLVAHARALHAVVRDPGAHPDWWAYCRDHQAALMGRVKRDLAV